MQTHHNNLKSKTLDVLPPSQPRPLVNSCELVNCTDQCGITQRSGVIWVPDALHLQPLQEEWGGQLPHQVNGQGVGLKDEMRRLSAEHHVHRNVDISTLTFPISGDHVTEMWLGTAEERRTSEVMLRGLPGLFCSRPFLAGGT